jgi:fucose 4-O-acetylase-like acetyltransferase
MTMPTVSERPVEAASQQSGTAPGPPNTSSRAAKPQRSMVIDVVRGIAITLVALGHTDQGVGHRNWWGTSQVGNRIDLAIYAFHMPAFFFISGVFLCASLDKRGLGRFILDKARVLIWPYLFYTCIGEVILRFLSSVTVQRPLPLREFFAGLATGSLNWFLPTIFFAVVLGALLRRLPMALCFALALAVSLWNPATPIAFVNRGLTFLPFVVLGMWVGRSFERIERVPAAAAAMVSTAILALILGITANRPTEGSWFFIPVGTLGTLMLLLVARLLGHSYLAQTLRWIGEASFGIFLLSPYAQGAGREILLILHHTTNPWVQLIVPTVLAVAIPAWIYQQRHRLRIAWTFHLPF